MLPPGVQGEGEASLQGEVEVELSSPVLQCLAKIQALGEQWVCIVHLRVPG